MIVYRIDDILPLLLGIAVIAAAFSIIYAVDKQTMKHGGIFANRPALRRIMAFVLGLICLGITLFEFFSSGGISFEFPLLAVGLLAYSLRAEIIAHQKSQVEEGQKIPPIPAGQGSTWQRIQGMIIILGIILVLAPGILVIFSVFYTPLWWIFSNSTAQRTILMSFVAGILILVLSRQANLIRSIYQKWKKSRQSG